MPYRITEDCISCGNCSVICPQDAIHDGYTYNTVSDITSTTDAMANPNQRYSVWQGYNITGVCDECGICVDMCPVEAIIKA